MATLKATIADSLSLNNAASAANNAIRKQEFDAALADRPTTATMSAAITAATHAPVTLGSSQSLSLSIDGQQLSGEVRLATGSGMSSGAGGLSLNWGSGANQVPAGNHTHANDHVAATADATAQTTTVTIGASQEVKVEVKLASGSWLQSTASGLKVDSNEVAAKVHSHDEATTGSSGFMSAADKTKLDNLAAAQSITVANSDTVLLSKSAGGEITGAAKLGFGLQSDSNGIKVNTSEVSAVGHTHALASASAAGFMSTTHYTALEGHMVVLTKVLHSLQRMQCQSMEGGTSTALDAQLTQAAYADLGAIAAVTDGTDIRFYSLKSGDTDTNGIITQRPLDYNASTNQRYWQLLTPVGE